jgi:hypothetical protein
VEAGAAQLLALDPSFWSKELLRWLQDRHSSRGDGDRLHSLLCRCLEAGPWRQHCQRLLQLLPQEDLLPFATDLLGGSSLPAPAAAAAGRDRESPAAAAAAPGLPGAWLVFRGARWPTQDALLLAVALGCCLPQLLRLLRDDELAAERQRVQQLVQRLLGVPTAPEQQATGAAHAVTAAHWRLRRQLQQQRSPVAELDLHEMLLMHLFASGVLVQQLASGGNGDAQQLQQLLTASGLPCQLAAPAASLSPVGRSRRRSHSSKKPDKKRRSKGSSKSKKKKRRRRSGGASSSGSEGSDAGSSDECDGDGSEPLLSPLVADAAAAASETAEQQQLWQQQGSTVTSMELLHAVIAATASAHARWLFGSCR